MDSSSLSIDEACAAYASAFCARLTTCWPSSVIQNYGGPSTCNAQEKLQCMHVAKLPGSRTLPSLEKCSADIAALSCKDLVNRNIASCSVSGDFANGEACVADDQCKGGYCSARNEAGCGKCADRVAKGGPCTTNEECAFGLLCAQTCVTPVGIDGMCSPTAPCSRDIHCGANQRCVPYTGENQSCDAPAAPCDFPKGLACSENKLCVKMTSVQPGQSCMSATPVLCSGGLCRPVNNVPTCTAFAKLGEACGGNGIPCLTPGQCLAGQCVLPHPSFCSQ